MPSYISVRSKGWFYLTSKTPSSVIIFETHFYPVKGRSHFFNNFGDPFFVLCSVKTTNLEPLATKSIAPPIPFTSFLGIIQLARSPFSATSIVPRNVAYKWDPQTNPNASLDEEYDAPKSAEIVYFEGSIKSGSSCPFLGNPLIPNIPFSPYRVTSKSLGNIDGTKAGIPIPKFI